MMPGGSASPDAHNSRSDDGKGEFASEPTHEHAVWNFSVPSTCTVNRVDVTSCRDVLVYYTTITSRRAC